MKRNVFRVTLCLLLVLLIGAAPMSALAAKSQVVMILKCNVEGGRLREGPSSAYEVITSLDKGEKVFYMGQQQESFCYVRTLYGQGGYIYRGFLETYGAARLDQIYYAPSKNVCLYRRPSTGASRTTVLGEGEHIIVYKIVGDWGFAKTLRGNTGFVPMSSLTKV